MSSLAQNARYAWRGIARSPGFAAIAVFALALGIGANTAIFSVANALLLRPLAYSHPDRLVLISAQRKGTPLTLGPISWTRFEQLREPTRSFSAVAGFTNEVFNLTGRGDPEQIPSARVSWNFFQILGVNPAFGRAFTEPEDRVGGDRVAVLSDAFWRRRFGADASILGRTLTLDQKDYTIIGVLPAGFRFDFLGRAVDLVTTRPDGLNILTPRQLRGGAGFLNAVARLRDGARIEQAQAEMEHLAVQYRSGHPGFPDADPGLVVRAGNLRDDTVANFRPAVLILFGAVGLVLLIACANVASLLVARALGRRREIAVRTALGARRGHLFRQLLTESLMLSLAGGGVGLFLSWWGTQAVVSLAAGNLPRAQEIGIDSQVLLFTLAISIVAGVLFGLAPGLQISRPDVNKVLRAEGRGSSPGHHRNAMLRLLVVGQVALSTVLLIGAGLLLRNFEQIRNSNPGFDAGHLLTMNITLPSARYSTNAQMVAFFDDLLKQVRTVPGVRAAAVTSALPANPIRFSPALPEGQPQVPLAERPIFTVQAFTPGFVETLRVPLLRGRSFTEYDKEGGTPVALVNDSVVRRYWPGQNPLGKRIWIGLRPQPVEVVGVLGDIHNISLSSDAQPEIYLPFAQLAWPFMNLVVRTDGDPRHYSAAVRARVFAADRDQPVTAVQSMEEVLDTAAAQPRFTTSLLGALSATALLLALVGIYGVIARSVVERTGEMGIRIALGARPGDILRLVLRQGLGVALAGIAIGLAASFGLMRMLTSQLYHITATDPLAFAGSAMLFLAVAALASYVPARRAMRVDLALALREQ